MKYVKEIPQFGHFNVLPQSLHLIIPKYALLVKTSKSNDCEPINPDYIFYKAAAICRKLYVTKSKNVGVGSLRSMFSKKQRRGCQPPKTFRAGGKIIRASAES